MKILYTSNVTVKAKDLEKWEKAEGFKPSDKAYKAAIRIANGLKGINPQLEFVAQDIHAMATIVEQEMGK